ncbi:MAG: hypothetical protein KF723_06555 [Rhizobiaceae bacterium]|nr:hypothetical protein [Rhizobiaceae bacterium]
MNRPVALSIATLLAVAMPALAQSTGTTDRLPQATQAPAAGDAMTPDMAVPDRSTTSATQPIDARQAALDAINGAREASAKLGTVSAISRINVVKISEIGGDPVEMQSAIDANKVHATGVQAAIKANAALSTKMSEENLDVSAVVAAHIEADGSVTVYVQ